MIALTFALITNHYPAGRQRLSPVFLFVGHFCSDPIQHGHRRGHASRSRLPPADQDPWGVHSAGHPTDRIHVCRETRHLLTGAEGQEHLRPIPALLSRILGRWRLAHAHCITNRSIKTIYNYLCNWGGNIMKLGHLVSFHSVCLAYNVNWVTSWKCLWLVEF